MTADLIINIGQQALQLTIVFMMLLLLPALAVGLLVSMFQAATQINEMTLSFIPKLLITIAVLVFAGPYMVRLITNYTVRLFESIPAFISG